MAFLSLENADLSHGFDRKHIVSPPPPFISLPSQAKGEKEEGSPLPSSSFLAPLSALLFSSFSVYPSFHPFIPTVLSSFHTPICYQSIIFRWNTGCCPSSFWSGGISLLVGYSQLPYTPFHSIYLCALYSVQYHEPQLSDFDLCFISFLQSFANLLSKCKSVRH